MNRLNNNHLRTAGGEEYKTSDTAAAVATSSANTATSSKSSWNEAPVAIVEHPHYDTIRFVRRTLNPYPRPEEKIAPFMQVLGNPVKAMGTLWEGKPAAPQETRTAPANFHEKTEALLVESPLHDLVVATTQSCATEAMRVVEENAAPFLTDAAREKELREVHEWIFAEQDVSSAATKAAHDAATKVIAGAWEAALAKAEER